MPFLRGPCGRRVHRPRSGSYVVAKGADGPAWRGERRPRVQLHAVASRQGETWTGARPGPIRVTGAGGTRWLANMYHQKVRADSCRPAKRWQKRDNGFSTNKMHTEWGARTPDHQIKSLAL